MTTGGDEPAWGTPDPQFGTTAAGSSADPPAAGGAGRPDHGTPDHDTPDYGTPDYGAPGYGTPGYGTPVAAGPGSGTLLTVGTVVVVERPRFGGPNSYDLYDETGEPLGAVFQEASIGGWLFGGAAQSTFRIVDLGNEVVGTILRPGSLGRSQFLVTDGYGTDVGTIEQENAFFAPQFRLTTADGLIMRLTGGQLGAREWQLVDGLDENVLMGRVTQQWAGLATLFTSAARFAVQLSPQLVGPHRLLALAATIGLDHVRDAKRR